jgi:hypothetical protein
LLLIVKKSLQNVKLCIAHVQLRLQIGDSR